MGILVLHKAPGERSTACVALVRRMLGKLKVGHAGTLDSPAEGVLLILVGAATRLSEYAMALSKEYVVEAQFGSTTSTDDAAGEMLEQRSWGSPEEICQRLDEKIPAFLGHRLQVPPAISAVHVEGRRAHQLTRSGEEPKIAPRMVFVSRLQRLGPVNHEGRVFLRVQCHKGTYIRSIVRDLGQVLGCGAHVRTLQRTRSGPFSLQHALSTDQLKFMTLSELKNRIFPDHVLVEAYPTYAPWDQETETALRHGRSVPFALLRRCHWGDHLPPPFVVLLSDGMVLGHHVLREQTPWFVPHAVLGTMKEERP